MLNELRFGLLGCALGLVFTVSGCGGGGGDGPTDTGVDANTDDNGTSQDGSTPDNGGADNGTADNGTADNGAEDLGPTDAGQCIARFSNCAAAPDDCCAGLMCDSELDVCVADTTPGDGGMCGGEAAACEVADPDCCVGLVCTMIGQNAFCAPDFSADSGMCVSGNTPCDVTADACCPGTECVAIIGNNGRCQQSIDGGTCVASGQFCAPGGQVGGTCCSGTCIPDVQFPTLFGTCQ